MKNGIVNELITAMKERIPKGQNLANSLADILYMGKEAVYRRLRGEVAFTIDEVALLSKKLGISIDQIIGNHLSNRVTFDMNLLHSPCLLYTASNLLPFTLYSSYEYMSKFRLCRWIYQNGQMKTPNSLAEMQVEDRIVKAHNKLSESVKQCRKTYFIWDSNIFLSFVKEIKYFASLNLITDCLLYTSPSPRDA